MYLDTIEIRNFRNIGEVSLSFHPKKNIILGKNAQGKTNMLEALWLLSGARSFRGAEENELVGFDKSGFFVGGSFKDGEKKVEVSFGAERESGTLVKKYVRDTKAYKSRRALLGAVPMTVFSPDDLELIKSGPSLRRGYCDGLLSVLFPPYAVTVSKYNRIVSQKNALLKDQSTAALDVWNTELSRFGASIVKSRCELIKRLLPYSEACFFDMTGKTETLSLKYDCRFFEQADEADEEEIQKVLYKKLCSEREREIAARACLYGAHRDDVKILINGREARQYGSQGQQRSAVLSLLLSKTELLCDKTGKAPIVLLDDVMSELDKGRRNYLCEKIEKFQVFITCCQDEIFNGNAERAVFSVNGGSFRRTE